MVDKFSESVRVVSEANNVETAVGKIEVVLEVGIEVSDYKGEEVSDEEVEQAAMEAIQEGRCRVVETRPVE